MIALKLKDISSIIETKVYTNIEIELQDIQKKFVMNNYLNKVKVFKMYPAIDDNLFDAFFRGEPVSLPTHQNREILASSWEEAKNLVKASFSPKSRISAYIKGDDTLLMYEETNNKSNT